MIVGFQSLKSSLTAEATNIQPRCSLRSVPASNIFLVTFLSQFSFLLEHQSSCCLLYTIYIIMPKLDQFKGLLRKFRRKEKNKAAATTTLQTAQDGSSSATRGDTPASAAEQVQVGKGLFSGESKGIAIEPTTKNIPQAVSKGVNMRRFF